MKGCETHFFEDDGTIPNNPNLPLLVYPDALTEDQMTSRQCKKLLAENGWRNAWVNGIFSYHHYHSTTHEVLAVISGSATVKMGGEEGSELSISSGDVIVIPAGVGHCLISCSNNFRVVGAYPGGRSYDLCTGKPEERPGVIENIKSTPLPEQDPVTGEKYPISKYWQSKK